MDEWSWGGGGGGHHFMDTCSCSFPACAAYSLARLSGGKKTSVKTGNYVLVKDEKHNFDVQEAINQCLLDILKNGVCYISSKRTETATL